MQPQQSDIESNKRATTTTTSQQPLPATATPTTTATNQQQQNRKHHHQHNHHHHHRSPKIIKGKKPLINFKFYLDIRDHQLTKSIEEKITSLGGCLEFFLTSSITHFVTDKQIQTSINNNNNTSSKNNNNSRPLTPQTPQTPGTPLTPYSPYEQSPGGVGDSTKNVGSGNAAFGSATATKIKKQSRADAMLNRVRRPSTTTTTTATIYENSNYNNNNNNTYNNQKISNNKNNSSLVITAKPNYIIWTPEYALRFFKRLTHDLKDYLVEGGGGASKKLNGANKPAGGTVEPISLKGGFIKIEAIKRNQRPYYQLFRKPTEWPKIELNREDGAFRLSPKRKPEPIAAELVVNLEPKKMTRKSRSRSSHNRTDTKDGGVQALKKNAPAEITKSNNGRLKANSNNADVGAVAAAAAVAACKQLKETSEKQCGVCEICKIEYDTLTIHLKTKDHEYFAKNTQNFIALDTLIHASANVNKFLDANKSLEVKSELEEEMEVVEDVANLDADAADPLEDHQPSQQRRRDEKPRSGGGGGGYTAHKTPSPTLLREKSKRSTKGKHSSEKFQNFCATKSSRGTSHSPQKKTSSVCTSKLELQSFKNEPPPTTAATTTATTTTPAVARKKPASCPVISPPIRAMLPPSSLYKVVETTVAQEGISTPPRKLLHEAGGETAAAVASPSLIVKFKKVRQAELTRLNGEAENFMFPRTRTSSDLPTDQDRQTTSENAASGSSAASISLESSSEPAQAMEAKSEDRENNENIAEQQKAAPEDNNDIANRHIVVAKRRKGRPPGSKTRFPSAPIQPGVFTLKSLLRTTTSPKKAKITATATATTTATTTTTTTATTSSQSSKDDAPYASSSSLKASACLTLPEATRKSSRTATAIVTAATTSSRLLRAAVEAAKNNQRLSNESTGRRRNSVTPSSLIVEMMAATVASRKTVTPVATPTASPTKSASAARKQIKSRNSKTTKATAAVKLEDRMGEDSDDDSNEEEEEEEEDTNEKDEYKKMKRFYADDDDDDDDLDSDDEEDDDDDDEDYVSNFRGYQLKMQIPTLAASRQKRYSCMNNREQRATNRATKKCLMKQEAPSIPSSSDDDDDDDDENIEEDDNGDDDDEDDADDRADDEGVNDKKQQKSAFKSDDENDSDFLGCEVEEEVVPVVKPKRKYTKRSSKTDPITPKPPKQPKCKPGPKPKKKSSLITCTALVSPRKTIQVAPHIAFDISKSERLQAHEYSFERVPVTELWYRVFQRQDKCEEKYFEYYGSTNYRKLPYELGPIPFNRTLDGISCKICGIGGGGAAEAADSKASSSAAAAEEKSKRSKVGKGVKEELPPDTLNNCAKAVTDATATATSTTTAPSSPTQCGGNASSSSNYTHKKLHLLQRYRREQQELLLKQQQLESSAADNCHGPATLIATKTAASSSSIASKASTPDREAHERRAGSIHSNASSCASSIDTMCSKSFPRNKHLNKAAFLNLELPPRKSPREHASTLALVSCLKQRQNSQSKPNSEVDEPTGTNTPIPPPLNCVEENSLSARKQQTTPPPLITSAATSTAAAAPDLAPELRCTRSAAGTPVEELRFTTEISENVKRLRRGQNKYDHSPLCNPTNRLDNVPPSSPARLDAAASATKLKRRIRQPNKYHSYTSGFTAAKGKKMKPSIRKTGQKKGVLEFEMDAAALKALETTRQYTDPRLLEWQIDKYLEYAGRTDDFDEDEVEILASVTTKSEVKPATKDDSKPAAKSTKATTASSTPPTSTTMPPTTNSTTTTLTTTDIISTTPPTTDYFSSDFDLYDLFMSSPEIVPDTEKDSCSSEQQSKKGKVKSHPFSLYSSAALQNYFKKRKSLKSNRTGWPKVHKKKISARQQQQITDQIRFLPNVSAEQPTVAAATLEVVKLEAKVAAESGGEEQGGGGGGGGKEQTPRQSVVITPPDSDTVADDDEDADGDEGEDEEEDEDEDDYDDDENGCKTADNETELDAAESIPEEEEEDYADTLAGDSVDDREADVEEEDDDDDDVEDIADEDEKDKAPERRDEECAKSDIEVAAENVNKRAPRADDDDVADDDEPVETDVPVEDEEPVDDDVPVDDDDDEPADEEDVRADDDEPAEDDVPADDDEPADDDVPADDDEPVEDEDDTLTNHEPPAKRMRRSTAVSPLEKLSISTNIPAATNASAHTSTPSTQLLRNLRRSTPHLNGSLGSCVSPIEKTGDNSDIFTVSSDGLDTDLDLSNSHSAIIKSGGGGAGEDQEAASTPCLNHTPKRKFDLAKYATNNSAAASSTCAAEAAATANAKSLAISQFLKKEVKVNCRRLRAPFRRFRYRR